MKYFTQLKLLIWKNWILRKRNKMRTTIEFMWPILIFFFLILLHNLGIRRYIPNCYFKPKAMPSAGELLFLQSLICSFNNTCDNLHNSSMEEYNESLLSSLGFLLMENFDIKEEYKNHSKINSIALMKRSKIAYKDYVKNNESFEFNQIVEKKSYFKDYKRLSKNLETHGESEMQELFKDFFASGSIKKNPTDFLKGSKNTLKMKSSNIIENAGKCYIKTNKFKKNFKTDESMSALWGKKFNTNPATKIYSSLNSSENEKGSGLDIVNSTISFTNFLDSTFCGSKVPPLINQIYSVLSEISLSKKYSLKKADPKQYSQPAEPFLENGKSDFCDNLSKNLSTKDSGKIIFGLLKPFLRGKILYTPDAPVINRIMSRINVTLNKVRYLRDFLDDLAEGNGTENLNVMISKYGRDMKFLKKVVQTKAGREFLQYHNDKSDGKNNDPKVIEADAKAFGSILEEAAKKFGNFGNNSITLFGFQSLRPYLECFDFNRIIPVPDEAQAVNASLKWLDRERLAALIVFVNVSSNAEELPPSLTYKIRTGIERTPKTTQIRDRLYITGVKRNVFRDIKHITGGFVYLQNLIETELIREYTGREKGPGIYLRQTPFPCHIHDSFLDIITRSLPVFMIISWCYTFGIIVKKIVAEKENHLKGTMRIFGMYNSQHWIAWFVDAYVPVIVIGLILSIMLVFGNIIPSSRLLLIWLFLITFALPTICLAFLISIFFSKSSFALNVSMVLFFLLYLIYPLIQNYGELINPNLKLSACLISNVAFGLGCTWIANMEEIGLGAQFNNMNFSPISGNPITMSFIIKIFFLDAAIYLLLAIYLENVYRTEESVRLPWNYFFTMAYWKSTPKKRRNQISVSDHYETDRSHFETEPENLTVGIETINLTKEYGKGTKKRRVVDNLNMKFYENQITSFLGHNGSGKTTSISMMSGLLPISSGTVLIYGVNLEEEPDIAGKDIGICRQENVLLEDLTVEEHLWLFSRLRNRSISETEKDMVKIIKDLQLDHTAQFPVRNLSGGMKRKVCLAMAFIGGPRTIFLDEPTAGVDPFSRRSIWDLLIKYKEGRTVILTTHFLDEADLLGDRIAIIGNSKLQCCGSSVFLKNNFGKGYYLTIENKMRPEKREHAIYVRESGKDNIFSSQTEELNKLIKAIIPEALFLEEIGNEITYILPQQTEPTAYNDLFTALDNNKNTLNFLSYGISNSSLIEVFFKIIQKVESEEEHVNYEKVSENETYINRGAALSSSEKIMEPEISERALDTRIRKIITQQFFALLIKRFHHHRRNYKLLIIELLVPATFIAIALLLILTLPAVEEMPPLTIDISAYSPSIIFYSKNFSNDPQIISYEKALLGPYGLGTKCVVSPEKCHLHTIAEGSLIGVKNNDIYRNCSCKNYNYRCEVNSNTKDPPNAKMSSGDQLYNLTSLDLIDWLVKSEFNMSQVRYGGIEFGYFNVWSGVALDNFFRLFMVKKFLPLMNKISVRNKKAFNTDILMNFLIAVSCDKAYGEELFKSAKLRDNIIIWFNNRGWIAGMAFMNGVTNLVLRASLPKGKDPSKYSITLINHPLPITRRQLEEDIEVQINTSLLTAIAIIWALSFIPAMFVIYIVEERMSGLKHLQIISGISKGVYWIVALFWDMILYTLNVMTIVILFLAFDIQTYINEDSFGVFLLLLYSYGFANITFVYVVSYMFITPSVAFVFVACYNIFVGMITLWTTFFLDLISYNDDPLYLKKIFLIFPPFCFGRSLIKIALAYNSMQIMKTFGVKSYTNYAAWSISLKYVVVMICLGILFFIATIFIHFRHFFQFFKRRRITAEKKLPNFEEEEDVKEERQRIESGAAEKGGDVLIVNNLTKFYLNSKIPAVDHICFGVKSGECFGLLGLNGAGKTTVFKILTGYIPISEGDATIGGYSLRRNIRKARLLTGYCPQGDALDPYLTCEEHLSLFSRIRGITGDKMMKVINRNLKRLGLAQHRHKIVKVLSGGNKRKLNTAIALLGDPDVVLLDEPTSGMDSHSRRFVWKSIQKIVNEGRCVVLTSHNMEECQALCTKLSVMVHGKLVCFGSCQHLKSKYDEGYNVRIRVENLESIDSAKNYILDKIPKSTLVYVQYLEMRFRLFSPTPLNLAFNVLNQAKQERLIQDYSLSQTTLENVFLKLADVSEPAASPMKLKFFERFCFNRC